MTSTTTYVTSDVHLGAVPEETRRAFHAWLEWAAASGDRILINGDLFDFWFEYGHVIPRGHSRTLGLLARIVDAGTPIHLTGGNHDWWTGSFLGDEIGLELHSEPFRIDLSGHDCLVAHGDGLGAGDLGYRMLRGVLRARVSRWAFRWLHPDIGAMVARGVSGTRHRQEHDLGPGSDRARELERWSREKLLEDETLDAVILGHTHLPRRVEIAPGRFYLNAGDWLRHHSFLTIEQGRPPRLARWDGTGPATVEQVVAMETPPT